LRVSRYIAIDRDVAVLRRRELREGATKFATKRGKARADARGVELRMDGIGCWLKCVSSQPSLIRDLLS
jgi:hypothetical protein